MESVTVSPDGRHLYAAGRFDNALATFLVSHVSLFKAHLPNRLPSTRVVGSR